MSFECVRWVETTHLIEHLNKLRLLQVAVENRESKIKEARLEFMEEVGKILSGNVSSGDRYTILFFFHKFSFFFIVR